jgi:hypothetical protein
LLAFLLLVIVLLAFLLMVIVMLVFLLLVIVLLVFLRFTAFDYRFDIFKFFLAKHLTRCCDVFYNRIKKCNFCNI